MDTVSSDMFSLLLFRSHPIQEKTLSACALVPGTRMYFLASLASLANLASLDRPADDPHLAESLELSHSMNGCACHSINGAPASILMAHATAYGLELLTLVVKDHAL